MTNQEQPDTRPGPERIARMFHESYERLAPSFAYETREASAKPWAEVPENNRRLMTAVVEEVSDALAEEVATRALPAVLIQQPPAPDTQSGGRPTDEIQATICLDCGHGHPSSGERGCSVTRVVRRLVCRVFGHRWMVKYEGVERPLWASQMLIAITALVGVEITCSRCGTIGHPPPAPPDDTKENARA